MSPQQYTGAIKEYGHDSLGALDAALQADLEELPADPTVGHETAASPSADR
jgi:hypothetical protein